jgi:hypothetical protein
MISPRTLASATCERLLPEQTRKDFELCLKKK